MPRKARRRGGKASKRGISDEQICVIGAVNREGKYFFKVVGNGRPTSQQIKESLEGHIEPGATHKSGIFLYHKRLHQHFIVTEPTRKEKGQENPEG